MIKEIYAKTILNHVKQPDTYFGLKYNMNLYRGCQHQCIYCDSRSDCYQIENFSDIHVKVNAVDLLADILPRKRVRGTIGFGSMNDPYMPVERAYQLCCRSLEVISKYQFPVHIITKSDLVLRDIVLLKEINQVYAAVSFTITAAEDELSKQIEPGAPPSSARSCSSSTGCTLPVRARSRSAACPRRRAGAACRGARPGGVGKRWGHLRRRARRDHGAPFPSRQPSCPQKSR